MMESIIFQDSPLADYLEGHGNADPDWPSSKPSTEPWSPTSVSFAPRGLPTVHSKLRKQTPNALKLDVLSSKNTVAHLHNTCSSALNSRLGRVENARFLEQFRYIIVASQLLSDHAKPVVYNPLNTHPGPSVQLVQAVAPSEEERKILLSWPGLCATAAVAFAIAGSIQWTKSIAQTDSGGWSIFFILVFIGTSISILYAYLRRHRLEYLRKHAIGTASLLISNAQNLDATTSTAITLIQEVELVSRGYRISSPLPPISRLEEQSQTRRCGRLRRVLNSTITSMFIPYTEAYEDLKPHAIGLDFEKYCDIYEISQEDIEEVADMVSARNVEIEDAESLKTLRVSLRKLHLVRKLYLCVLLALDADGGKPDFSRWAVAIDTMEGLSSKSTDAAIELDKILSEEDRYALPPTPKYPLTPGRERMRTQMRKLGTLSQGIRGLQAKLHILREESDRTLNDSDDVSELGSNLITQYESIGADLKSLMQEWEDGKARLVSNIDKHERRISLSSIANLQSRSPTPSLGGLTAVEGSPTDALRILNGEGPLGSSIESTSSDEEVFEAIAVPRQKSTLTREERMAKMREDRVRQAIVREKADASTHMLKELETVIKLRPRGRTTGRISSI